jgi:FMN phosphatase YigB (HAD superfamily)
MAIKAVFFDIGNVLLRFDACAVARTMARAAARNPAKLAEYLWTQGPSKFNDALERGEISSSELYRIFRDDFRFDGGLQEFRRLWCDHFTLEAGTAELLDRLRLSHRVYLLSNTNEMHYDFIHRHFDFPKQVHGAVLSYRVGARKPEREIFAAALALAGVPAGQAVFIDDLPRNVSAARKLGITALRYTGIAALRRELTGLGVLEAS